MGREQNGQPAVLQPTSKPESNSRREPALCQTAPHRGVHRAFVLLSPRSCSPCLPTWHEADAVSIALKRSQLYSAHPCPPPQAKPGVSTGCFCCAAKCAVHLGQHVQESPNAKQKPPSFPQTKPHQNKHQFQNRKWMPLICHHNFTATLFHEERIYYFKNLLLLVFSPH